MRNLERQLGKVLRKVAAAVARGDDAAGRGRRRRRRASYLGRPVVPPEVAPTAPRCPGVATGLAVTGAGGDVLFVEADGDADARRASRA